MDFTFKGLSVGFGMFVIDFGVVSVVEVSFFCNSGWGCRSVILLHKRKL